MKNNFTAWEWIAIIFAVVVGYSIMVIFTGIGFLKIPTTPENMELRKQIIAMVNNISVGLLAICAGKILNNKNSDK